MRQCYRLSGRGQGLRYSLPAIALAIACLLSGPGRADAEEFVVGGLNFTAPAGWQRVVAPTPMRKAMFRVPNATGDGAVTFYHFGPGLGGGPQANIERWRRQFQGAGRATGAPGSKPRWSAAGSCICFAATARCCRARRAAQRPKCRAYAFLGAVIERSEWRRIRPIHRANPACRHRRSRVSQNGRGRVQP